MTSDATREKLGLPKREFLYTTDQIAGLLQVQTAWVEKNLLHYYGKSLGPRPRDKMLATNIAPDGKRPIWRVTESSLVAYMKLKGIRV